MQRSTSVYSFETLCSLGERFYVMLKLPILSLEEKNTKYH